MKEREGAREREDKHDGILRHKPISFTDQHHGQQPGGSVVVLMEEQARSSEAAGDQL